MGSAALRLLVKVDGLGFSGIGFRVWKARMEKKEKLASYSLGFYEGFYGGQFSAPY